MSPTTLHRLERLVAGLAGAAAPYVTQWATGAIGWRAAAALSAAAIVTYLGGVVHLAAVETKATTQARAVVAMGAQVTGQASEGLAVVERSTTG